MASTINNKDNIKNVALLFPGQGSQSVGMLSEILSSQKKAQVRFEQASEVLGLDMVALTQDELAMHKTENTQPLLLTASVAIWDTIMDHLTERVGAVAGHSLGEYSALVVAGVMDFEVALKLVRLRGQLMQTAVPAGQGAMAAVLGLSEEVIDSLCQRTSTTDAPVSIANLNTPEQTVIAGEKNAVEKVCLACKEAGVKRVVPLAVSVPSHCAMMRSAADELAKYIDAISFSSPKMPVYQNFTANVASSISEIKTNLLKQLYSPLRWYQSIQLMQQHGIKDFVECGSGKVLSGMMKKISPEASAFPEMRVFSSDSPEALAKLFELFPR